MYCCPSRCACLHHAGKMMMLFQNQNRSQSRSRLLSSMPSTKQTMPHAKTLACANRPKYCSKVVHNSKIICAFARNFKFLTQEKCVIQ